MINFTVDDFLQRSKRLFILNQIKCLQLGKESTNGLVFPVHHKHRKKIVSTPVLHQNDIDQIDVEHVIIDAYEKALHILNGLGLVDLLRKRDLLELNASSEFIFKQWGIHSQIKDNATQMTNEIVDPFESNDDDPDEDENASASQCEVLDGIDGYEYGDGIGLSANDYSVDEQNDSKDNIVSCKREFPGMRIFDNVQPHLRSSYFEVKVNSTTKYVHKQFACWMLADNRSRLSNDRLSRVIQTHARN